MTYMYGLIAGVRFKPASLVGFVDMEDLMKNKTKGKLMIAALLVVISFGFYLLGGYLNVLVIWALWCIGYLLCLYITKASKLLLSDD